MLKSIIGKVLSIIGRGLVLSDLLFHYPQVEYSAVIYYKTSKGDSSYIDSFEITTSDNS